MKCGCLYYWGKTKKGKKVRRRLAHPSWIKFHGMTLKEWLENYNCQSMYKKVQQEDIGVCQGEIEAKVEAVDEPGWGYTTAVLQISFTCKECGETFEVGMPKDSESLSKFLTSVIANISEEEREKMVDAEVEAEKERMKRAEEFLNQNKGNKKNQRKLP